MTHLKAHKVFYGKPPKDRILWKAFEHNALRIAYTFLRINSCPKSQRTHHNEKETTRPQNQRDKMANWEKFLTIAREQTTNL